MNTHAMIALAKRFGQQRAQQAPPTRAIPQLPPGLPHADQPHMRFNPGVQLDPSQVEDRRGMIYPGGRAGAGGDRPADQGEFGVMAAAPQLQPQHLQQLATLFALMQRRMTSPTLAPKTRRRG